MKFEWDLEGIFSRVKFSKKKMREKTSVDVTDFYSAGSRIKNTYHLHKNSWSFVFLQKTVCPYQDNYTYFCLSWKLEMSRADLEKIDTCFLSSLVLCVFLDFSA